EGIGRRRVAESGKRARTIFQVVKIDEKEGLLASIVDLGNNHRTAEGEAISVISLFGNSGREETASVECVIGEVLVTAPMEILRSALGRVFDGAAAGMPELRRIGRFDDAHLADALDGRSALVAVLVARSVAERDPVEEVL